MMHLCVGRFPQKLPHQLVKLIYRDKQAAFYDSFTFLKQFHLRSTFRSTYLCYTLCVNIYTILKKHLARRIMLQWQSGHQSELS